ncbi:MAG: CoA transferase [Chloroflexi bacterium]|nr:CoA transferase [Chloroflexota bacterium]
MLPLDDVRVLDLTQMVAGPYCTIFLADQGAEVIKIEPPKTGEAGRRLDPLLGPPGNQVSGFFLRLNRNKKSLPIDLRQPDGKEIFRDLVKVSDVVVENFRPGVMNRLGLGYEALRKLNPRIIYASISGFGHDDIFQSPYSDRPAFAIVAEAMGGVMDLAGEEDGPPVWGGYGLGDLQAGSMAAQGILVALYARARTREGQHVDVSMVDSIASLNERTIATYGMTGEVLTRGKERFVCPFGVYKAKDGYVVIAVVGELIWKRFCRAIGRDDWAEDERLNSGGKRADCVHEVLNPAISAWIGARTRAEAVEHLTEHEVPAAPVYNGKDLFDDPHLRSREMIVELEHPVAGKIAVAGSPIKLSAFPHIPRVAPAELGQHTDEILGGLLAYSDERIADLRGRGVV